MTSRRLVADWLVPLLFGLLFALLFAAQNFAQAQFVGRAQAWRDALAAALPRWLLYSLMAPGVAWCVRRYPLAAGRLAPRLAVHLAAATAFALLHSAGLGCYFAAFHLYPAGETLLGATRRLALVFAGTNLLVYCGIAGAYHAHRYLDEVRQRELLASELRASLAAASLGALRAQLNPHFLFNTLNAVATLALAGRREDVVRVLGRLADLLRASFDPELPQEIPLERELGFLGAYLEIQQLRFGERLAVTVDAPAELKEALVPAMLLQPIVENAFEHGVARQAGAGSVAVSVRRDGEWLRVEVDDSGPGFAAGTPDAGRSGIGLRNCRARLEQLYGAAHGLVLGDGPAGGARVEVRLPWRVAGTPA